MLRITIHEDGKVCRLELAGRLEGPWVLETEYAWRSLLRSGRCQIELDMRELTGLDNAGRELLLAMHLAGVRLVVEGVWMKALIEEITGDQPIEGTIQQSRKNKVPAGQGSGSRRSNK
jgi:hypothetical protein